MSTRASNWHPGAIHVRLCEITLSDIYAVRDASYLPGDATWDTKTIRLCDHADSGQGGVFVYGGNDYFVGLLDFDVSPGDVVWGGGSQDSDAKIRLSNHRYVWQKRHTANPQETTNLDVKLSQILRDYNATKVVLVDLAYLPSTSSYDAQQIFSGVIMDPGTDEDEFFLYAVEDRRFDKAIPNMATPSGGMGPGIITKKDYPNAPKAELGRSLPILYSQKIVSYTGDQDNGAGLLTNPRYMVALSPCRNTEFFRVVANRFPAQTAGSGTRYFAWMDQVGTLATIDTTNTDNTTESYCDIDPAAVWHIWVPMSSVKASSGVTNPLHAFDGRHDTYASIANSGATAYLEMYMPYWSQLGQIEEVYTTVLLKDTSSGVGASGTDINARFGIYNSAVPDWHFKDASDTTNPVKLTKSELNTVGFFSKTGNSWLKGSGKWNEAHEPWTRWSWEGEAVTGERQDCYFRIEVTQNGANVDVVACGMLIDFKPFANAAFSRHIK